MGTSEQKENGLTPVTSLEEFFRDSLDSAMAANQVVIDDHAAHYVVNLLTLFARSEDFYEPGPEGPQLRPLALMLSDALEASNTDERNFALQRLGDVSLFVAGFFADGLRTAAVDVDYYVRMGGGAYHSLAGSLRGTLRGRAFGDVFDELGSKFGSVVDVLHEVRESARSNSDEDAMRLYELWFKTGSERARRLLQAMGIHPMEQARTGYSH
jgi:hypothetical protein